MPWTRLLLTWLVLALLMPVNGVVRELGLKRLLSERAAEWASAASGIVLILVVTRAGFRIPASEPTMRLLGYTATLVALTVAYEFGIGAGDGKAFKEMLGHYAIWRGEPWPLVLAALALMPWLWRGR